MCKWELLPSLSLQACQTEEGLSNVAAAAEQFQPKGITLATTEVSLHTLCIYTYAELKIRLWV